MVSALSYGIPVVSTPIGVEGAGLEAEKNVLVAQTPEQFAQAVLRLYQDEALWNRLSRNGQELVASEFSLDMGKRVLAQALQTALAQKLGIPS